MFIIVAGDHRMGRTFSNHFVKCSRIIYFWQFRMMYNKLGWIEVVSCFIDIWLSFAGWKPQIWRTWRRLAKTKAKLLFVFLCFFGCPSLWTALNNVYRFSLVVSNSIHTADEISWITNLVIFWSSDFVIILQNYYIFSCNLLEWELIAGRCIELMVMQLNVFANLIHDWRQPMTKVVTQKWFDFRLHCFLCLVLCYN